MLKAHLDAVENELLVTSKRPANSGHNLHKGTPREAFIKEFLEGHLSEKVAIGTGEIIDANSQPGEKRNQIDIVIYKRDYPKIDFGGGINGFLVESVVATIEVKSVLTKDELKKAFLSAQKIKQLTRNESSAFRVGYKAPSVMSYVVSYDGPVSMKTVYGWKDDIAAKENISYPVMEPEFHKRMQIASPAIDGIFNLGKGFMYFDNAPLGFLKDAQRQQDPTAKWVYGDNSTGNLLLLFMVLCQIVGGTSSDILNPIPYLSNATVSNLAWGK